MAGHHLRKVEVHLYMASLQPRLELCINRRVNSPLELSESRFFHLRSMTYLSSRLTCSAFALFGLTQRVALYTLLCSSETISIGVIKGWTIEVLVYCCYTMALLTTVRDQNTPFFAA